MKYRNIRHIERFKRDLNDPDRSLAVMLNFAIKALTPVIAFLSALILIDEGQKANWDLLWSISDPIVIPSALVKLPIVGGVFFNLAHISFIKAIFLFTLVFWLIYAAIFSIIYAVLMKFFGPSYYKKYDVPWSKPKQ